MSHALAFAARPCRALLGATLVLLAAGAAPPWSGSDPELPSAEKTLRDAGVAVDGPGLLAFFRERTLSEADRARLAETVRLLGSESFADRENASAALVRAGRAARPLLLPALKSDDLEVRRRAERCLEIIDRSSAAGVDAAAARVLAARKPGGAVEALLAYAPVADEEDVEEAVLAALLSLGVERGKVHPTLVKALADREPARRAAAAHVLGWRIHSQRPAVRRLLKDPDPTVRFRAASTLVHAEDPEAVPALIALVGEGPEKLARLAEGLLVRVAGESAPAATVGESAEARRAAREGWAAWWKASAGKADLSRLTAEDAPLGITLVCIFDGGKMGLGRVVALGRDGKPLWEIGDVRSPADARLLPGRRVLIAEHGGRVTERDTKGTILWEYAISTNPVSCERLRNGNTLIATFSELLEVDRAGKKVASWKPRPGWIYSIHKLRDGGLLYAHQSGVVALDAAGKEAWSVPLKGMENWGRVEPLPGGRYLVPQWDGDRVLEVDRSGKILWQSSVTKATSAQRLSDGHTLATDSQGNKVVELDRAGKVVRSWPVEGRPFRVRRY